MKTIDSEGEERGESCKLKRWVYTYQGSHFIWHVDGYNKLKTFSAFPFTEQSTLSWRRPLSYTKQSTDLQRDWLLFDNGLRHERVNGFSRKILWLKICPSNNNPYIIWYFWMKCISNLIVSRKQFELIRALKMLLWLVCSGLLGEGIRTLCLDIQVFYSEALQLINE